MAKFLIEASKGKGKIQAVEVTGQALAAQVAAAFVALMKNNPEHPAAYPNWWTNQTGRHCLAVKWQDGKIFAKITKL